MGQRDAAGALLAIALRPGAPQPIRGVEPRRILLGDEACPFLAQPAQHGIDQPLMGEEAARFREIDGGGDGGVRRRAQEEQLRDTEPQHVMHHRSPRRQRGIEAMGDQRVDLAQAAQNGRHQQPRKGAIPCRQPGHLGIVLDGVIERPLASEHDANEIDRHATRGGRGRRDGCGMYCQGSVPKVPEWYRLTLRPKVRSSHGSISSHGRAHAPAPPPFGFQIELRHG